MMQLKQEKNFPSSKFLQTVHNLKDGFPAVLFFEEPRKSRKSTEVFLWRFIFCPKKSQEKVFEKQDEIESFFIKKSLKNIDFPVE